VGGCLPSHVDQPARVSPAGARLDRRNPRAVWLLSANIERATGCRCRATALRGGRDRQLASTARCGAYPKGLATVYNITV
jgi:hypothetical protein